MFADGGQEWRFAYDPVVHEPLNPVIRVALVAGLVGGKGWPYELGVEETATKGARPPGANWKWYCCFYTVTMLTAPEQRNCIGSDANCKGSTGKNFHSWVAWRRVEVNYNEEFDAPDNFEEHVRHVRKQATKYKRSRLKLVHSERDEKR